MSAPTTALRPPAVRLAGALLAVGLLAAGCGESAPEPPAPTSGAAASDGGGTTSSEASDGGGQTAAAVPQEALPVTPAPDGFTPPEPCSGEGAYFAEVGGGAASPELPERAGETLTITAEGIDGADAQLSATVGDGSARPIEDITLGETVQIDLWTLSVTSVCEDTQQVEFDLID